MSLSLLLALFQKEVKQPYYGEGHSDHSEIVKVVALLVFRKSDVAHHGKIDQKNERDDC